MGEYGTDSVPIFDPEMQDENICDSKAPSYPRKIRHDFIRKVYGILVVQLSITAAFSFLCMHVEKLSNWLNNGGEWLLGLAVILSFVMVITISCFRNVARTYPTNYLLLFIFTLCQSLIVGNITAKTDPYIVTQATLCTVIVVVGLTIFASQTKYDFTSCYGLLLSLLLSLIVFGFLTMCFRQNRLMVNLYCCLGTLLFSVYLIADTQLIIGRGKLRLTEDDYIIAAMMLYIDIINLFLELLKLFSTESNQ